MQIQLRQADIEQAIKNHIAAIGIQREVDEIHFTMGRKSSGLVADINVSDHINVPAGPINRSTTVEHSTPEEKAAVSVAAVDESTESPVEEETEEPVLREEEAATDTQEKTSLFGS